MPETIERLARALIREIEAGDYREAPSPDHAPHRLVMSEAFMELKRALGEEGEG